MVSLCSWLTLLAVSVCICAEQTQRRASSTVRLRYTQLPPEGWAYELQATSESTQSFLGLGDGGSNSVTGTVQGSLRLRPQAATAETLLVRMQVDSFALRIQLQGMERPVKDTTWIPSEGAATLYAFSPSGQLYWRRSEPADTAAEEWLGGELSTVVAFPQWLLPLPAEAIPVGYRWESTRQDTAQLSRLSTIVSRRGQHVLEALVDTLGYRCARIQTTAELTTTATGQTDFGSFSYEAKGRLHGTSYLELATGLPILNSEHIEEEGTMAIRGQVELIGTMERTTHYQLRRR